MDCRWHVEISGSEIDLEWMRGRLQTGSARLAAVDGKWFLTSDDFSEIHDTTDVDRSAKDLLFRLNLAFTVTTTGFSRIKLGQSIMQVKQDGTCLTHHFVRPDTGHMRLTGGEIGGSRFGLPQKPIVSTEEKMAALAASNEDFRAALSAFSVRPTTFASLYVVYEIIKKALDPNMKNDVERGFKKLAELNWVPIEKLEALYRTAQLYRHAPDPKKPKSANSTGMTLDVAIRLLRRLLHRWAEHLWKASYPEPI